MKWRGSPCPCPHRRKVWPWEQGYCKTLISLPVWIFFFVFVSFCFVFFPLWDVTWNCSCLLFFLKKYSLAPCQGGLEKAKAGTNWNLQVSNSHFSFSTRSLALLGFLQLGCCFSWHLQSFPFLEEVEMLSPVSNGCWSAVPWEQDFSRKPSVRKARQPWAKYSLRVISFLAHSNFLALLLLHEVLPHE